MIAFSIVPCITATVHYKTIKASIANTVVPTVARRNQNSNRFSLQQKKKSYKELQQLISETNEQTNSKTRLLGVVS
jgi:hypothetical protein